MNQNLWNEYVQTVRELREAREAHHEALVHEAAASAKANDAFESWHKKREELLASAELELLST